MERCVSKAWCSSIDSPHLGKAHQKRPSQCNTNIGVIIGGFLSYLLDFDSLDDTTDIEIDEPLRTPLYSIRLVGS